MKKNQVFSGAATALITPMKSGNIDYPALAKILETQISAGISALVVGGTTGEAATLSDGERYELYTYVKENGGKVAIDEIANATGRNARSIGANVTDLAKKGLAIREKVAGEGEDAKDVTYVVLTEEGMNFVPSED